MINEDLIELSNSKYGVFNVDEWKEILSNIVAKKIDEFQVEEENKEEMTEKISEFLYEAISEFEKSFKTENKKKSFLGISGKNVLVNAVDLFDRVREKVPTLSKQVIEFFSEPENRERLKEFVESKIDKYADQTFAEVDYSQLNNVLATYDLETIDEARPHLSKLLQQGKKEINIYKGILYGACVLLIIILLASKKLEKRDLALALVVCVGLLSLGLLLPMIDIDARISDFSFIILGEPVNFKDQVLYFKSKSILEVVVLMLSQGDIEVVVVGALVFSFSVLFPVLKLIASYLHLLAPTMRNQGWIKFFVFKSGKWSMADVLVVAIFMSYIGFSSILTEQLRQLEDLSENLQILTTNASKLNTGFYMFFGFVLLGLIVSDRIKKHQAAW